MSPGAARPDEMICCTSAWFWFRIACSSAYTLNAVICWGGCTPGVALVGVRQLNQPHIQQHLASPIQQLAQRLR